MKLRFKINQADCLRRGIDAPKSILTIEVNPNALSPEARFLIARHMDGIDVCILDDTGKPMHELHGKDKMRPRLIEATEPTINGLLVAVGWKGEAKGLTDEQKKVAESGMRD
jgi:hypothetical protein